MGVRKFVEFDENDEIIGVREIKENEEMVIQKVRTPEQKKFLTSKYKLNEFHKNNGGFVFMYVKKDEILFNGLNLQLANISRLIYLATYIEYNYGKENLLVIKDSTNKAQPMTKQEMMKLLKLKQKAFYDFIKDLKESKLLYEVDDKFYLSSDYFSRGKCRFNEKEYVRIYIKTVRDLYEGCTPRQHKTLSYVFRLLPKVHYELNVICHNPLDKKPVKMSLRDIGEFLEIHDRGNQNKLQNNLLKIKMLCDDVKYSVFKKIMIYDDKGKFDYFVVNPKLYWGGNKTEKVVYVIDELTCR